jgi:hypothetical protein
MPKKYNLILIGIILSSLVLRFSLIFVDYHGDLRNNTSWAEIGFQKGLANYYESQPDSGWPYSKPNQPPLYILLFTALYNIWQFIDKQSWLLNQKISLFPSSFIWFWKDNGLTLLVKIPSIMSDVGIAILIYKFFSGDKDKNKGTLLAAIWLFNPVTWYNSSVWGQTDSVVNLLGLTAILFLVKKDLIKFSLFFTLSFLFKASLAIFTPVLLAFAFSQKHKIKTWLYSIVIALSAIFIVCIWFHPQFDLLFWLISLYRNRILSGEIGFLTANAFNFWWLVDSGRVPDSTAYLGVKANIWGYLMTSLGIIAIIFWLRKGVSNKKIFFSLSVTSLLTFLFMTRIHERYLYPFFPVGTLLIGFIPLFIIPYVVLAIVNVLNLSHLFWMPFQPIKDLLNSTNFANILSVISIITFTGIILSPLFSRIRKRKYIIY